METKKHIRQEIFSRRKAASDREILEGSRKIFEAVRALPEELRSVIVLRYFTGLTLEETAAALEIPRGTVSSRQRRALELLRLDLTDGQEVGS